MTRILSFIIILLCAPATTHAAPKNYGSFENVQFVSCYDGDTCFFNIPGVHPLIGERIGVRIRGIDTPEIRGKCPEEKTSAKAARDFLNGFLRGSDNIKIKSPVMVKLDDVQRGKYFRIIADIVAEGKSISELMTKHGYAVSYNGKGKKRDWCKH